MTAGTLNCGTRGSSVLFLVFSGAVICFCPESKSCSGEAPDIIPAWLLCAPVGVNPVGVRLVGPYVDDPVGKLVALLDAAFATGEEAPAISPLERDLLRPFQATLADLYQCFGPDSSLLSVIWD